jgi:hypothetical protein
VGQDFQTGEVFSAQIVSAYSGNYISFVRMGVMVRLSTCSIFTMKINEIAMKKFFYNNGLSIAFLFLFTVSIIGQVHFGIEEYNKHITQEGGTPVKLSAYLTSGHFLQSTFENWESEFLQMALFVILTIFLQQKGSSESKDLDKAEHVDRKAYRKGKNVPWPVNKGGLYLKIYENSLTIVFILLFILSFVFHFYGSFRDENNELMLKALPQLSFIHYMTDSRGWFESFQNWQSEFLSVFALVILSIYLRQKGSPQSKPVDAPHSQTGE